MDISLKKLPIYRQEEGVSAVETAFLLPVILVTLMLLFEISRMVLVIILGNLALNSSLNQLRTYRDINLNQTDVVADIIAQSMANESFGYLRNVNINPEVVLYPNLKMLVDTGENKDEENTENDENAPIILSVYVNIELPYMTPLPSMLLLPDTFGYRFHQVTGSLYSAKPG